MPSTEPTPPPPAASRDYLFIDGTDLASRPMSGPAWDALKAVADGNPGRPNLTNMDNRHGAKLLAAALVYARTGDEVYRDKVAQGIFAAVGTEREKARSSILALGRQLGAYVLAADLIGLSGEDDAAFRAWLSDIRTRELGSHGRWTSLTTTHEDAGNNWGAFAGASRIAASLYLGDMADIEAAADVLAGFLGDRQAWSGFRGQGAKNRDLERTESPWACDPSASAFVPVNGPCTKEGIDLDGAIVGDVYRDERGLTWPPGRDGLLYTAESLQGLVLQAELLRQAGYDPYEWVDRALLRMALFFERAGGWNASSVSYHVAWIFNRRYDLSLPTMPAGYGRLFGYTDWLYGD